MPGINRSWGPEYLVRWFFDQGEIWVTAMGDEKRIVDMADDHLLNTLLMLERVQDDLPLRKPLQETALYRAMKGQVLDRIDANRVIKRENYEQWRSRGFPVRRWS